MKVLISGGGTGGHIFPAMAIADALKEKKPGIDILFVGARGKMEMEKVPKAGYTIKGLWIAGLQRSLTIRNVWVPFKLAFSLFHALWIILRFKPDVSVGVGGYASGPVLFISSLLGIPTLIQEQNSYAGMTNKILGRRAKKICVAYKGMEAFFREDKIVLTGNPVRKEMIKVTTMNGKEEKLKMGFNPELPLVLVLGGSLGARTINHAIAQGEKFPESVTGYSILWQAGQLYYDEFSNRPIAGLPNIKVVAFIEDMAAAYSMADLVVCRAGALTLSEITLTGKPAILIPSPNVAEDHQTVNAMALVKEEAAIMISDNEAVKVLLPVMQSLLNDRVKLKALAEAAAKLGSAHAADMIAGEILKLKKDS